MQPSRRFRATFHFACHGGVSYPVSRYGDVTPSIVARARVFPARLAAPIDSAPVRLHRLPRPSVWAPQGPADMLRADDASRTSTRNHRLGPSSPLATGDSSLVTRGANAEMVRTGRACRTSCGSRPGDRPEPLYKIAALLRGRSVAAAARPSGERQTIIYTFGGGASRLPPGATALAGPG